MILSPVAAVNYAALDKFSIACVLRNGPRILRACAQVQAEIEAEQKGQKGAQDVS